MSRSISRRFDRLARGFPHNLSLDEIYRVKLARFAEKANDRQLRALKHALDLVRAERVTALAAPSYKGIRGRG